MKSCFFGPLRALHMRFHDYFALMRFLAEMSCFLVAELLFVVAMCEEFDFEGCGRLSGHDGY
jgi:hypothetical protein